MLTSFYTALTGLNSNAMTINVIGNNLANINTTAFKGSRTSFSELLGAASQGTNGTGNPIQIGQGVASPNISPIFTQGSIQYTGLATDAAISGNGFFVVRTGTGEQGYTRAGNFSFDGAGNLVSSDGLKTLGYTTLNGAIDTTQPIAPISIPKGSSLPPSSTTKVGINANLDSKAAVNDTFSTSVQTYDSLGTSHTITLTFTKTGANAWGYAATIPAVDTGGLSTAPPVSVGTGSLTFSSSGVMTAPITNPTLTVTGLSSGAANLTMKLELLDSNNVPRITNFGSASSVSSTTQDGYTSSMLKDISIDSAGVVSGVFENGQVRPMAQLALATFNNDNGLIKFAGSTSIKSGASGEPSVGTAGTGGRGEITGSSLELSNVDIAQQFTDMIVAQRGYQANSKVLTTSDSLYQDVLNLIR